MEKKSLPVTRTGGDDNSKKQVDETVNRIITNLVPDLKIISGENEEIQTSNYLLSLFSPSLSPLLSSSCCTTSTLFLPDCSTSSIHNIVELINIGFVFSDYLSWEDRLEIISI